MERTLTIAPPPFFASRGAKARAHAQRTDEVSWSHYKLAAQTSEEGFQDVAPKLIVNKFTGTPDDNQAGDFQLFHVMRKGWRSDLEASPHGFAGQRLSGAADLLDDLVPTRISERFGDVLHLILGQSGQFGLLHFFGDQRSNSRSVFRLFVFTEKPANNGLAAAIRARRMREATYGLAIRCYPKSPGRRRCLQK